ncbi:MAG: hypothetical protein KGK03_00015 [Candidatus Omnitrophica bacterium]|nr:hypothetical protein [Candidatus Omnitrophota bacterium]MDE2221439.1 hypothetical protein [Candidatus Omnitrophota bacterium]
MIETSLENIIQVPVSLMEAFLLVVDDHRQIRAEPVLRLDMAWDNELTIKGWFWPQTIFLLRVNPAMSVVVVHLQNHGSYQINGECLRMREVAFLDRLAPIERQQPFPQTLVELTLAVDEVKEVRRV